MYDDEMDEIREEHRHRDCPLPRAQVQKVRAEFATEMAALLALDGADDPEVQAWAQILGIASLRLRRKYAPQEKDGV